ncbi:MAG TPA: polyhydroxyalkanoic acid system family protein [Bryobacteraceae bacterium]|nr:polyhydroxyalkanoic acid system family protein [Bryobacteraceae bacterium]
MKITVSHNKGLKEAMRIVDQSSDDLFKGIPAGPIEIVDKQKSWNGSTMTFSVTGKMGFFKAPLSGTVLVTEKDVTIECELPGLLKRFMPEDKVKSNVEARVRGLLGSAPVTKA